MTKCEKPEARMIVGYWYDSEEKAKAWCDRQSKPAIVVKAQHPNGTIWYIAMLKSIADRAAINMEFVVYRKLIHETKNI